MTRYTYIHLHVYILYIYIYTCTYIYLYTLYLSIYIHSCINISIHVCVNVYTSRFITVQSLFLPTFLLPSNCFPTDLFASSTWISASRCACAAAWAASRALQRWPGSAVVTGRFWWSDTSSSCAFLIWALDTSTASNPLLPSKNSCYVWRFYYLCKKQTHLGHFKQQKRLESTENKQIAWIQSKSSWETCGFQDLWLFETPFLWFC